VRRAALAALVGALLAATAGCGARWSEEERAALVAQKQGGSDRRSGERTGGGTVGGDGTTEAGPSGVAGPQEGRPASAGEPGGSETGPSGPRPCAAPSDAPGVTASELRVGSISSLSGPVPGLGASSAAATRAYVAYRNSIGGSCGRELVLQEGDDGTDSGRYRSLIARLAPEVLGIAGGFALGDVGGLDVIEAAALPVVTVPSDDRGTALPTLFDLNPPFEAPDLVVGKYRYLHEHGVRRATQVYLAVDQSRLEAQRQAALMRAAGIEIVDVHELPISTLSYDAAARRAANTRAEYLFFIGDAQGNGSMARAVQDAGYEPRFAEYFTFAYGEDFVEVAGADAAEGATSWIRSLPNEEAGGNEEMARFLEWMDRIAPDTVRDVFAADAWAAAKAFFDSLEAIPGPITREALVAQLRSVEVYDAGGMLGPIRLGAELTNGCVIGMQVRDGAWRRMTPADGFLC
jgi:branched-chain amino acid transport system substrate-binding protein